MRLFNFFKKKQPPETDRKHLSVDINDENLPIDERLNELSVAAQKSFMENEAVDRKRWVYTGDYRNDSENCRNHAQMNGVIVAKDKPFVLKGLDGTIYYPMHPRDPILPDAERIGCKCIHQGIANDEILGLSLEERERLQQQAIEEENGKWDEEKEKWILGDEDKELDAKNRAKAGIETDEIKYFEISREQQIINKKMYRLESTALEIIEKSKETLTPENEKEILNIINQIESHLNPNRIADIYKKLGGLYELHGSYDEAVSAYGSGLRLNPNLAVKNNIKRLHNKLNTGG